MPPFQFPDGKRLAAFDFDNTVVAGNTDIVIRDLVKHEIPSHVQDLVKTEGWTRYMEEVFRIIHNCKAQYKRDELVKLIRDIPQVPGFINLFKALKKNNFDLIIISDANTEFIEVWLDYNGVSDLFTAIFTNPAHFKEDGLLVIKPYHFQTECKLSPENLCKGKILKDFMKERQVHDGITYDGVIYVGDGTNDICPILKLDEQQIGCVRQDYGMHRVLNKNKQLKSKVRAKLVFWNSGFDLISEFKSIFNLEE